MHRKHERCSGKCMRLEHERSYGLGMSALANAHTWNTNANIIPAWMLWKIYALEAQMLVWLGHACAGHRSLIKPRTLDDNSMVGA